MVYNRIVKFIWSHGLDWEYGAFCGLDPDCGASRYGYWHYCVNINSQRVNAAATQPTAEAARGN